MNESEYIFVPFSIARSKVLSFEARAVWIHLSSDLFDGDLPEFAKKSEETRKALKELTDKGFLEVKGNLIILREKGKKK